MTYKKPRDLVDIIFEQPYCRIGNLVERDIAQRQSASKYLKALVKVGILEEQAHGRERLFIHSKYLKLLQDDSNIVKTYDWSI